MRFLLTFAALLAVQVAHADDVYFSVRPKAGGSGEWRRIDAPFKAGPETDSYRKNVLDPHFEVRVERVTPNAPLPVPLVREPVEPETLRKTPHADAVRQEQQDATAAFAGAVAEMKRMNNEVVDLVRRMDARLARVEMDSASVKKDMENVSAQLTDKERRLTALERGTVTPWKAPSVITDPNAATAAGRVVGSYDQFGRFVPAGSAPLPPPTFPAPSTQVFSSVPMQTVVLPAASFPVGGSYGAGAGACSSGSCGGSGGRRGLFGLRRR